MVPSLGIKVRAVIQAGRVVGVGFGFGLHGSLV